MIATSPNRAFHLVWTLALASLHLLGAVVGFATAIDDPGLYWPAVLGLISAWGLVWRTWWAPGAATLACAAVLVAGPVYAISEGLPGGWATALTLLGVLAWLLAAAFCAVSIQRLRTFEMLALFPRRPDRLRPFRLALTFVFVGVVAAAGIVLHSERTQQAVIGWIEKPIEEWIRRDLQQGLDEFIAAVRANDPARREQAVQRIAAAGRPFHRPQRLLPGLVEEELSRLHPVEAAGIRRALMELVTGWKTYELGQSVTDFYHHRLQDPDVRIRLLAARHIDGPRVPSFSDDVESIAAAIEAEPDPDVRLELVRTLADSAAYWKNQEQFLEQLSIPLRRSLRDESAAVQQEATKGVEAIDRARGKSPGVPRSGGAH